MKTLGLSSTKTKRFENLKRELFKGQMLVEVNFDDERWQAYNELLSKVLKANELSESRSVNNE